MTHEQEDSLADELREARRLLRDCLSLLRAAHWNAMDHQVDSFLTRTSWVEQQGTK